MTTAPFEAIDMECKQCGKTMHFDSAEGWITHPEAQGWVRFQAVKDYANATPWFCCVDHLIEWAQANK